MLTKFEQLIQGKTVALVGNNTPQTDLSEEIDNHDVVIRLNHFYNISSNKVGKKVDAIITTPTMTWKLMTDEERNYKIIQEQHPTIFVAKHYQRIDNKIRNHHYKGCEIHELDRTLTDWTEIYTTGTMALYALTKCYNFKVDCYCFSFDDDWKSYIDEFATHYQRTQNKEEKFRKSLLDKLKFKQLFPEVLKFYPVITVRKGSSLKDKNIRLYKNKPLLQHAIEKCLEAFGEVTVLSDSENYNRLAEQWGATVPYLDDEIDDNEDVTVRLRKWRDKCDINGRIILVQCTSPNITVDSLKRVISNDIDHKSVVMSCYKFDDVKYSAFLFLDESKNCLHQAIPNSPQISKPRQCLKPLYHYNGAITSFHSTQLDFDSLFDNASLIPLMISEQERLDIDNERDFD